jgi:YHS domain-containing protein
VAGGELGSMGDPIDYVYGNRLVRFCCASCIKKFEAEPGKYMAMIDKAYADAQRAAYALNTCVVAGGELGSMGEPVELVAGTQLVRFCCKACVPAFKKEPQKYLAKVK